MSMENSSSKDNRFRNWSFILYDESAPIDWRARLDELHIQWVESPLHEFDVNPTGELKKAHRHILLLFEGKKSYEQIKELTDALNCPIPQRCQSVKGSVRYMAHLDNPEKYQYSIRDVVAHGGVDLADLLCPTKTERYSLINEMRAFIKDNGIKEFQDILDYAAENRPDDWFPLLCDSCTIVINQYLKSARHRSDPH